MNAKAKRLALALGLLALTASVAVILNPFTRAQQQRQPLIKIDGSSTVYPITVVIAKEFKASVANQAEIKIGISGTSGGFEKFCAGEDISDASRPILSAEMEACQQSRHLFKPEVI